MLFTAVMRQIRPDLFETTPHTPDGGPHTHAYLWTGGPDGNVLFYSTAGTADFDEMERLGGVAHQYLSHQDEVSGVLRDIGERFGAVLHSHVAERDIVAEVREPDVVIEHRHVDGNGIEVIPTPGHTPGSACFVVTGVDGLRYLFTGDTIFLGRDGRWLAGYIPGFSDADDLADTLQLLAGLDPDVVVSSAFAGDDGAHVLGDVPWPDCVAEAAAGLPSGVRSR